MVYEIRHIRIVLGPFAFYMPLIIQGDVTVNTFENEYKITFCFITAQTWDLQRGDNKKKLMFDKCDVSFIYNLNRIKILPLSV